MKMVFKIAAMSALAITVASCGSSSSDTGTGTTTDGAQYTATFKAIISNNCAGCHSGSQAPNLSTFASVKSNRAEMLLQINAGLMPPAPSSAWTSTDKARLVDYLTNSTELK